MQWRGEKSSSRQVSNMPHFLWLPVSAPNLKPSTFDIAQPHLSAHYWCSRVEAIDMMLPCTQRRSMISEIVVCNGWSVTGIDGYEGSACCMMHQGKAVHVSTTQCSGRLRSVIRKFIVHFTGLFPTTYFPTFPSTRVSQLFHKQSVPTHTCHLIILWGTRRTRNYQGLCYYYNLCGVKTRALTIIYSSPQGQGSETQSSISPDAYVMLLEWYFTVVLTTNAPYSKWYITGEDTNLNKTFGYLISVLTFY